MIVRILALFLALVLPELVCIAQVSKLDSVNSTTTSMNRNALRFSIAPDRLFQAIGVKHWFSDAFAISGHCVGAYRRIEDRAGTALVSVRDVAMYGGLYAQGEYHWQHDGKAFTQGISPYLAAGIGVGVSETSSWFIAGSILIGAEIFLTSSLSVAVEQGVDISYEKYTVFYPTEPFLSLLPFSKASNNRLLLHIYF